MSTDDKEWLITGLDERQSAAFYAIQRKDGSMAEIAQSVGVTERTLHRWRKLPEWLAAEELWIGAATHGAKMLLANALDEAAQTLIDVIRGVASPADKIRAASEIMDRVGLRTTQAISITHQAAAPDASVDLGALNAALTDIDAQ